MIECFFVCLFVCLLVCWFLRLFALLFCLLACFFVSPLFSGTFFLSFVHRSRDIAFLLPIRSSFLRRKEDDSEEKRIKEEAPKLRST